MTSATKLASTSAVAALVLATVWLFWPSSLGGATTYVSTTGTSMEPDFHTGDLALLSTADSYAVGDVVAYHSESLDTIVMHRVVAVEGGRFVTQGDNNDWLDDDRPTEDEILGELFFSIPQGGTALDALRSPGVFLPLLAVAAAVLAAGARKPPVRASLRALRRRAARFSLPAAAAEVDEPQAAGGARTRLSSTSARALARQVALGAGGVTLLAAVACGVLLAVPTTQTETRTLQVTQEGRFSYTGDAVVGTTYPTGVVSTGDTVWNRLVDDLTVSLDTAVTGAGITGTAGTLHLDVVVSAPDGWSAVLTSGAPATLTGGRATAAVDVDPEAAAELLGRHHEETGTSAGGATLTVTPVGETTGTVSGRAFRAEAPAGLAFALDGTSLRPTSTDDAAFAPVTRTAVDIEEAGPRSIAVLALTVSIGQARTFAGAVLLLALVTFVVAAWLGRLGRDDVADSFLVRHADRILPVASFSPAGTVIDVSDAESLHRVAERFDTVVLHHAGDAEDTFAVRDVDATYRFVVPIGPDGRRGKPPVPAARVADPAPEPADVTGPLGYRGLFA
ncbi:signal peptidase I [Blastococcus haudaquaticus]|uniref:Signal peptidase I n=1 Tax=Blastococcus haudaquaticus TaxID=1938745 RepID=A0A286H958_9ACTN|nr:signal peptidase I [Blastococcus haudaquaticus]SOE03784.1 signal peptidase I [Blastococcus haudaquaticus]